MAAASGVPSASRVDSVDIIVLCVSEAESECRLQTHNLPPSRQRRVPTSGTDNGLKCDNLYRTGWSRDVVWLK